MTEQCQEWIAYCTQKYPLGGDVLEVGSFDVNGNPRHHFAEKERFPSYIGIDMREGPCVDRAMNVQQMDFEDNRFDVIVDAERLEHDNRFWLSIKEIYRVCKPGGYLIVTTRSWGGMQPHNYPNDYWRFMDSGLRDLLEYAGFECLATAYGERWAAGHKAVFAVGRKPTRGAPLIEKKATRRPFSIVIPGGNANNLRSCVQAIQTHEPDLGAERIFVVDDGVLSEASDLPVTWLDGVKPFIFSRNVNIGIKAANSDVIVLNDDAILQTSSGFSLLAGLNYGVISAAISGFVGNRNQMKNEGMTGGGLRPEKRMLCFMAIFIPKDVQDKVGLLDERFTGYGFEDDDYSRRCLESGIPLGIYDGCVVEHGSLDSVWRKVKHPDNWKQLMAENAVRYEEKWACSGKR